MKKTMIAVLVFIFSLTAALPLQAAAPTDPIATVKATVDKVIAILKNPSLKGLAKEPERRKEIRVAVTELFDFGEMAKRSLGIYWKERTPAERKEFTSLFTDLLERSYINRIEGYTDEKIVYDSQDVEGEYAVVKSRLTTKRGEDIPVDYKLLKEGGKWDVYDLVIENVSLVNNYRIQFNKVIRSTSYAELIKKMKNKAESEAFQAPQKKAK